MILMAGKSNNDESKDTRKRLIDINKQIDSIENVRYKNYTKNLDRRFKALLDRQQKMLDQIYDGMDAKEAKRIKKSLADQQATMRKALQNWNKHSATVRKDLKFTEKIATKLFYFNRQKDLRKLEEETRNKFREIEKNGENMSKGLSSQFASVAEKLRDWKTALNVDQIASNIDEVSKSTREMRIELQKYSGLTNEQWSNLKDHAKEFSKQTGYAIDNVKYLNNFSDIMIKLKIDDKDLAQKYADIGTKFQAATDVGIEDQGKLMEISQGDGMGGADYVKRTESAMLAIQKMDGMFTNASDLMTSYNENIDKWKALANNNAEMLQQYTNQGMALTTASNSGYIDNLDKKLFEIMDKSLSDIADDGLAAGMEMNVKQLMKQGKGKEAAQAYIEGLNQMVVQTGGPGSDAWKELSKEMDLGDINLDQITSAKNVRDFMSAYDQTMQTIGQNAADNGALLENYKPDVTVFDKLRNWVKASEVGGWLSDAADEMGIDSAMDVFAVISLLTPIFKQLGGFSKLAGASLGGVSSAGTALEGAAAGAAGLAGILGAIGTIAGLWSAGEDAMKAFNTEGKESQDAGFSAATKVGMVGTGAAAGAAIGSVVPVVGTVVGALVGGGLGGIAAILEGTEVGKWLSDQFDAAMPVVEQAIDDIGTWFSDCFSAMGQWLSDGWDTAVTVVTQITDDIGTWFSNCFDQLGQWFSNGWDSVTNYISNAISALGNRLWENLLTTIGGADLIMENLFKMMGYDWAQFKKDVAQGINDIFNWFSNKWDSIKQIVSNNWDYIKQVASNTWDSIKNSALNIWNTIDQAVQNEINYWSGLLQSVWNDVTTAASNAWNAITAVVQNEINYWVGLFQYAWDSFKNAASTAWSTITGAVSSVITAIDNAWKNSIFYQGLSTLGNAITNGAASVAAFFDNWFKAANNRGHQVVDGSHKDGLDRVPFDGYVAELHKDETVLTASQADSWHNIQANANAESATDFMRKAYAATKIDKAALIASYQAAQSRQNGGGTSQNLSIASSADIAGLMKAFEGLGYSKPAAAGILGNMGRETGGTYNPSIIQNNGKGPAAGLGQWENYNDKSERWAALDAYAKSIGRSWDDATAQVNFVDLEMRNGPGTDPTTSIVLEKYGGYEAYKQMQDYATATEVFEKAFERGSVIAMDERIQYAKKAMNSYDVGTPWVPNDQVALIHQGEMIVPADQNPYNTSSPSGPSPSDNSDVVQVLKWGFNKLEKAIKDGNSSTVYSLANAVKSKSEEDSAFSFT